MHIMQTLADSYCATGGRLYHKEALETLCSIVSLEVKDPHTVAAAEAEQYAPPSGCVNRVEKAAACNYSVCRPMLSLPSKAIQKIA